jgi:uncharacterized protein YecE (DUF72 family)
MALHGVPGSNVTIGTAGWSLPRDPDNPIPPDGSSLSRYAGIFGGTEINSSFHRKHRTSTYLRWAASVPDDFRFSVKMTKRITHVQRLVATQDLLDAFLEETAALGERRGCVLIQLPPSLAFVPGDVDHFLDALRSRYAGDAALEPRHESWFSVASAKTLEQYRVARVAADPARVPQAAQPGAWSGLAYWRLHGSPQIYRSSYSDAQLSDLAIRIQRAKRVARTVWCIFDNTASSAAAANAAALQRLVAKR